MIITNSDKLKNMKAVILAGGIGTRISEETYLRPKPMVDIGGKPILWHIMKIYSAYGVNDFIICCGYKGYVIKEYFSNYFLHMSDVTFDIAKNQMHVHQQKAEPWKVTLVDTGEKTLTGGRLKRVEQYVKNEDAFCFTYGDGVSDVNISSVVDYHRTQHVKATLVAVIPPGRFGALEITGNKVRSFTEKPKGDGGGFINGGFFVLSPDVINLIKDDNTTWEREPLERLAHDGELAAFPHHGFWQPMDTLRDKIYLEDLWNSGKAPWKVWT
jgi:glucose-1-phosphate cytidylyltransferase